MNVFLPYFLSLAAMLDVVWFPSIFDLLPNRDNAGTWLIIGILVAAVVAVTTLVLKKMHKEDKK